MIINIILIISFILLVIYLVRKYPAVNPYAPVEKPAEKYVIGYSDSDRGVYLEPLVENVVYDYIRAGTHPDDAEIWRFFDDGTKERVGVGGFVEHRDLSPRELHEIELELNSLRKIEDQVQ